LTDYYIWKDEDSEILANANIILMKIGEFSLKIELSPKKKGHWELSSDYLLATV
jgi:hypothetical protein